MTYEELSNQFDIYYNNLTSNLAPGCSEYEKSVFLTKALDEIIKNYFNPSSKGNNTGQGFDDSAKRQADFSILMKTSSFNSASLADSEGNIKYKIGDDEKTFSISRLDDRSLVYAFPSDVFIVINESFKDSNGNRYQVVPLKFSDYTLNMSKPYKRPLKNLVWRLINSGESSTLQKFVELITSPIIKNTDQCTYTVRYIRRPKPIILGDTDGLSINGYAVNEINGKDEINAKGIYESKNPMSCELDPILHEDILQRAVELAKIAWAGNQEELALTQLQMTAGTRSE